MDNGMQSVKKQFISREDEDLAVEGATCTYYVTTEVVEATDLADLHLPTLEDGRTFEAMFTYLHALQEDLNDMAVTNLEDLRGVRKVLEGATRDLLALEVQRRGFRPTTVTIEQVLDNGQVPEGSQILNRIEDSGASPSKSKATEGRESRRESEATGGP